MTEITLPSTVTSFARGNNDQSSFYNCTGLTSVTFNCSVPSYALYVSDVSSPFRGCTNIRNVTIGEGCTSIEYYAFLNCD